MLSIKDNNVIGNPCDEFTAVKVVPYPEYFSYLIVRLPAEEKISKVTMTFYIDSFKTESSEYTSTNFWAYKSTGVAYYVFSPNDKVFPRRRDSKAPPGTMTTVSSVSSQKFTLPH